jgi:hypothetical protein
MEPVLVVFVIFSTFFGIFYLYFSTRNKERLALIEKGADASIFMSKERRITPLWKILILNVALVLMAVGVGIFLGYTLHYNLGIEEGVAYPGTIFLLAGLGLFGGFQLTKKLG